MGAAPEVEPSPKLWPRRYRKIVYRQGRTALFIVACYVVIVAAYIIYWRRFIPSEVIFTFDRTVFFICGLPSSAILAHYFLILRPMILSEVVLHPDKIVIHRKTKETVIPLRDIAFIGYGAGRRGGTWFHFQMRDGRKHRFSSLLARADELLEAAVKTNPTLIPEDTLKLLRRRLVVADHQRARIEGSTRTKPHGLFLGFSSFLPAAALILRYYPALLDRTLNLKLFGWWCGGSVVTVSIVQSLAIYSINRFLNTKTVAQLEENPANKVRDISYERELYWQAAILLASLSLAFAVALFVLKPLS